MKKTIFFAILVFVLGCQHSSQPTQPTQPTQPITPDSTLAIDSVAFLNKIGSQSDSTHEIDFSWKDTSGAIHSLSDYKGKTILLNFWATWCPPCQEEIPSIEDIASHSGDSVKIIGVSVDETRPVFQTVSDFASREKMNYQIVLDSTSGLFEDYVRAFYGRAAIPRTFVISRNGIVKFVLLGSQSEQTFDSCIARAN